MLRDEQTCLIHHAFILSTANKESGISTGKWYSKKMEESDLKRRKDESPMHEIYNNSNGTTVEQNSLRMRVFISVDSIGLNVHLQ
jgi:hypothetical protein